MPTFDIFTDSSLGYSHNGEVIASGEGSVELTDKEVQLLIDLIRENDGECDVNKLELKDKFPDIFEKLQDVYCNVAKDAEYDHWVLEGYENGWYDVPDEAIVEKCETKYGFSFEYNPEDFINEGKSKVDEDKLMDAKMEALYDWLDQYRIEHLDQEIAFLADVFNLHPNVDDIEYDVVIPTEIIELAKSKQ